MAAKKGSRSLEETPTWAVAVVCFVLVAVSIVIEYILHLIGKWLKSRNKPALYEALEKIKAELMLMGFISLMLTVGQGPISDICISESVGATWHPCNKKQEIKAKVDPKSPYGDKCTAKGKVPFVTAYGIHQLHIFIFVLAVFHVLYCIITLVLGRVKMRRWKAWEMETTTVDYQFSHDPERFRFARDTSFGRRHLNFWTHSSVLLWIVCFFRQFVRSVPKVDYLTLRHGFIIAHLAPQSQTKFNFQKYINRSLEDDFKVVVGISPTIWLCAILFLLFNTHGTYSYLWLPFLPLIIILLVGTKLQVVITKMALRIQERGEVVKGNLVVQPGDDLFWFNRPRFILYLIHFVLFQNAFQLAFFIWTLYEFGLKSCFHEKLEDVIIRITMGVLIQILCSYVTLPLYALVTQMGSNMKPTIFNERVATALRKWHHSAKKHIKQTRQPGSVTPMTSAPGTPLHAMSAHGMSPIHLLRHYRSERESFQASPRTSNMDKEVWESERGVSPSQQHDDVPWSKHNRNEGVEDEERDGQAPSSTHALSGGQSSSVHHEIDIHPSQPANFSFDKRPRA